MSFEVLTSGGGSFSPTFATSAQKYYVGSSFSVVGARNGSFYRPFETYDDAISAAGEPTSSSDYTTTYIIEFLDEESYTQTLPLPTRRMLIKMNGADVSVTGNVIEIDNAQRFGSSTAPSYIFQGRFGSFNSRLTGGFNVELKSGGTAINAFTLGFINNFIIGNIVIADGTNGTGGAVVTSNVSCTFESTLHLSQILARAMDVSFINSEIRTSSSLEIGNLNEIDSSDIRSLEIYEYGTATTQRSVTGLTLNTAGGVTWDLVNSDDNWTVDALSASEIITKIDSQPNGTINLTKVDYRAIEGLESGTYTPTLTGVANITSLTAYACQYMRLGSTVTVSGKLDVEATSNNTQTTFGLSLPIASAFTAEEQLGGSGHTNDNTSAGHGVSILADATNDRAEFDYYETHGGTDTISFTFTYTII